MLVHASIHDSSSNTSLPNSIGNRDDSASGTAWARITAYNILIQSEAAAAVLSLLKSNRRSEKIHASALLDCTFAGVHAAFPILAALEWVQLRVGGDVSLDVSCGERSALVEAHGGIGWEELRSGACRDLWEGESRGMAREGQHCKSDCLKHCC